MLLAVCAAFASLTVPPLPRLDGNLAATHSFSGAANWLIPNHVLLGVRGPVLLLLPWLGRVSASLRSHRVDASRRVAGQSKQGPRQLARPHHGNPMRGRMRHVRLAAVGASADGLAAALSSGPRELRKRRQQHRRRRGAFCPLPNRRLAAGLVNRMAGRKRRRAGGARAARRGALHPLFCRRECRRMRQSRAVPPSTRPPPPAPPQRAHCARVRLAHGHSAAAQGSWPAACSACSTKA